MRNLFKTLAALVAAAVAMTACQTAPVETVETNRLIKTVEFTTEEVETRTAFTEPDGDSYPVRWMAGDEVALFPNDLSLLQTIEVEPQQEGRTAKLQASFALEEASEYYFWMMSPASALTSPGSGTAGTLTIPTEQYPTATSVDPAAQILQARTDKLETLPERIVLSPSHLSSYIKLSLINVGSDLGEIKYVELGFEVPVAGQVSYDFKTRTLNFDTGTPSKTVTSYVDNATDVWFGLFPALVGGTKMTVKISGTGGALVREITFPEDKVLFMGKIATFTVDMASATPPTPPGGETVFSRISEARFVTEGARFVMATAADDLSYGLSATQGSDFRLGVPVTKSHSGAKAGEGVETIVNPSDDVEILTVEAGTKDGVYAFKTKAGKYLAVDASKSSALLSIDSKTTMSDWRIKYKDGDCSFECVTPSYTYGLRYRKNDNKFLAFRPSFVAANQPIALYKLEGSGGSDWKLDPDLHLSKTSLTLTEGDTQRLAVALCYSLDDGGVVTFRSEDPSVATVSDKGDVTAVKQGETYIWAHVGETENYQADSVSCKVTVLPPVPVSSVTFDKTKMTIIEGYTDVLTVTVSPSNAADKKLVWSISDESVISLSVESGTVYAEKPGTATITATSVMDPTKKATCTVTVKPFIAVTGVSLDQSSLRMQKGQTAKLTATVTPSDASNVDLFWGSDNTSVAEVDQEGNVTAKSDILGVSCNIVVIARNKDKGNEYSASCKVTIGAAPVLKLQIAMSMVETAYWRDYTGPFELGWTNQHYYFRLYDTANDQIVKEGTFGVAEGVSKSIHMGDQYSLYPLSYFWEVVLKREGFLSFTLTYKNEEQGINWSQEAMVYYPIDLGLSEDSDYSGLLGDYDEVNVYPGTTKLLYIRNQKRQEYEVMDPEYLTITGDQSVAEMALQSGGFRFVITPKKVGETTLHLKYQHPYGSRMERDVYIKVQDRYAVYYSGSELGTIVYQGVGRCYQHKYTYNDVGGNTLTYRLYDRETKQFVSSGISVNYVDSYNYQHVTTSVQSGGNINVKVYDTGQARLDISCGGEVVATLYVEIAAPEFKVIMSIDPTNWSSSMITEMVNGQHFKLGYGVTRYFRIYDITHSCYWAGATNASHGNCISGSWVSYSPGYRYQATGAERGISNLFLSAQLANAAGNKKDVFSCKLVAHIPRELGFSSNSANYYDFKNVGLKIGSRMNDVYFWDKSNNKVLEIDYENKDYITVTNEYPRYGDYELNYDRVRNTFQILFLGTMEGTAKFTVSYNDGFGTSYSETFQFSVFDEYETKWRYWKNSESYFIQPGETITIKKGNSFTFYPTKANYVNLSGNLDRFGYFYMLNRSLFDSFMNYTISTSDLNNNSNSSYDIKVNGTVIAHVSIDASGNPANYIISAKNKGTFTLCPCIVDGGWIVNSVPHRAGIYFTVTVN